MTESDADTVLHPRCSHGAGNYLIERDPSGSLNGRCAVCGAWAHYGARKEEPPVTDADTVREALAALAELTEGVPGHLRLDGKALAALERLVAVAKMVDYYGEALIAREYEPGSHSIRELVVKARETL